ERARVAFVGCGGAGCSVLRRVAAPPNATRIALNDAVHPSMADVSTRVLLASGSLQAYASMDEKAVPNMETDEEKEISAALLDRDLVVMLGGLGGELGGWGMSLVGRVTRILGDASIAFATVPFTIEGPIRRQLAEAQLRLLQKRAARRHRVGECAFRHERRSDRRASAGRPMIRRRPMKTDRAGSSGACSALARGGGAIVVHWKGDSDPAGPQRRQGPHRGDGPRRVVRAARGPRRHPEGRGERREGRRDGSRPPQRVRSVCEGLLR